MKILISGGAGFIGSALASNLVARGEEVTILDNFSPQIHGEDITQSPLLQQIPKNVNVIEGDVRKREDWYKAIVGQDIIIHLAAETGTGQSMYEIDRYVDVNIRGTSLLLDILANKEPGCETVKRLVVASSRAIYGEGKYQGASGPFYPKSRSSKNLESGVYECLDDQTGEQALPMATDEDSKIHPSSIYGITKQVQEQLVIVGANAIGLSSIALRYQNVYGPGQSLKNPYTGILSIFSTLLLQGKDINIFEDGKESRDFVYIDDVIDATIAAIYSDVSGEAYNVGSGEKIDVITVANTLKKNYDSKSNIKITGNYRVGDIRHNYADLKKIKKDLNFTPKIKFTEGIAAFSEWVKTQDITDSGYERSVKELRDKKLFK